MMKNLVSLCVLVVLTTYQGKAQWPHHVDTSFSSLTIPDSTVDVSEDIGITVKGNNTLIRFEPDLGGSSFSDGTILVNGSSYPSIRMSSDSPGTSSISNLVTFAENSDSTFVVCGSPEVTIGQYAYATARARVTTVGHPDSTELAISFYNSTHLTIKGLHLNDSILFLLVDGILNVTTVELVLNNGQPQSGTALTDTGAAFLKIDRSTGAIIKQVYFNHNANDGWLNRTYFNTNSLTKEGNHFFFTSVSSLNENFILHIYDTDLSLINDVAIMTDPYQPGSQEEEHHFADRVTGYGQYNGQEYIGLIAKKIPVVVKLSTLDVEYIHEGAVFNHYSSASSAFFVDSAFIFLSGAWIQRVELSTMIPSIIRRDWITNSSTLDGRGISTAQRSARLSGAGFSSATLVNGQIEYYGIHRILNFTNPPSGMYINGDQIPVGPLASGDVVVYKGSLGLSIAGPAGTETVFSCSNCDSVLRIGNRVIYVVPDSASLANVQLIRTTGLNNAVISPGTSDVIDFSSDSVVVFTLDFLTAGDISTIWVYLESAIVNTTPTNDTSGISLDENQDVFVSLYPNPFSDYINLKGVGGRDYGISLYDISGRIVFQRKNIDHRIDLSHLITGIYIAHISDHHGESISVQKVIKQ